MKKNKRGFTMAELLIVVAIIAVLVGISIPVFLHQLEVSREATDLANVRSAYAAVMTAANSHQKNVSYYDEATQCYSATVELVQKVDGWATKDEMMIGGISSVKDRGDRWRKDPVAGSYCTVSYNTFSNKAIITWGGYSVDNDTQWIISGSGDNKTIALGSKSYKDTWVCDSVPTLINAKNGTGQKLYVSKIDANSPALKKVYDEGGAIEIGYFIVDSDNKILYDSGGKTVSLTNDVSYEIKTDKVAIGQDVKVAVQFFKIKDRNNRNKGSVAISAQESAELEALFDFK